MCTRVLSAYVLVFVFAAFDVLLIVSSLCLSCLLFIVKEVRKTIETIRDLNMSLKEIKVWDLSMHAATSVTHVSAIRC